MDSDETITTADEFNESLNDLMRTACENGVDVEGGWECRNRTGNPDWDVVILEMTKRPDQETT